MLRTLLLIVLFAISPSFSIQSESKFLKHLRKEFGKSPACSIELEKFNECVKPHEFLVGYMEQKMDKNNEVLFNIELMTEVSKFARNFSSCFGYDVQCDISKIIVFALDAADFVASKVYGDAFSCFQDSNIIELKEYCSGNEFERGFREKPVNDTIRNQMFEKVVLKCAAKRLYPTPSCSIGRLVHLYQAFHVGMESALLVEQFMKGHPVVLDFDVSKYCNN